jgi:hypothetical protein
MKNKYEKSETRRTDAEAHPSAYGTDAYTPAAYIHAGASKNQKQYRIYAQPK